VSRFTWRLKAGYLFLLIVLLFVSGCGGQIPVLSPPTATSTLVPPTETPTPTLTLTPTLTPLPPVGVLLAPPEADTSLVAKLQSIMGESIPAAGLRFQVRPSLSPQDIRTDDFQLIVVVPPAPDLGALVSSAPDVNFLALGVGGLDPAPNLSVIGSEEDALDQQGFLAGYIAALITPDWRVGVIGVADSPAAQVARQSFTAGVEYFCGLCLPTYPPFIEYPLYIELNTGAEDFEWQTAADFLIQRSVETIYVVPGAGGEALLRYLAQEEVKIIGGVLPPTGVEDHWVASLRFLPYPIFEDFWPRFIEGERGQILNVPLSITEINADLFSPGRQRLAEALLREVQAGFVDPRAGDLAEENP
jgi:hypothetical protein